MRLASLDRCRALATWRSLQRDEEGIALVLAILIMLVLTIVLGSVIFMTAAAARDAHRSNAGQKASALAESGLNNALAVLNANYPGITIFPGDANLLLTTTLTAPVTTLPASTTINVASTLGYNAGANTISVGPPARSAAPGSPQRASPAAPAASPAHTRPERRSPGRPLPEAGRRPGRGRWSTSRTTQAGNGSGS